MKLGMARWGLLALTLGLLAGCTDTGAPPSSTPSTVATSPVSSCVATSTPAATAAASGITVTDVHGAAKSSEANTGPNNPANPWTTITAASVDANGKLVVDFKVTTDAAGKNPFTTPIPGSSLRMSIAQLRAGDNAGDSDYWVSYLNKAVTRTTALDPETGKPFGMTAAGYKMNQPQQETASTGTLTTNCNGTYRYVSAVALTGGINISANNTDVSLLPNGGVYAYNAALTHRVAIEIRPASAGAIGAATMGANNASLDFVPDGKTAMMSREVVNTANCNNGCHKTLALHGGPRLDVKICVTCHNPTNGDPESGNNLDLKVMAHKIHSAKYLPSVNFDKAGDLNSLYKNNPEGAVKGTPYTIWGYGNSAVDFSEVVLPNNPANCTVCHSNAANADNYKTKPTKEACGSCHDGINFATGAGKRMWFVDSKITMGVGVGGAEVTRTDAAGFAAQIAAGHKGGPIGKNAACAICHTPSGTQAGPDASPAPITASHGDFGDSYPLGWSKAKTDFTVSLTMSAPANGTNYVAGEKPIVTIVLKDAATGLAIDHTKIGDASTSDFGAGTATGNLYGLANADGTPKGVTTNGALNFYVSGPRALRKPALTTVAANKGFFALDGSIGSSTLANDLRARSGANAVLEDDVSATKLTGVISRVDAAKLQYQLSAIPANMTPGTYVAMVLTTKKSTAGAVPKAMSLGVTTFQVGQATPEKQIAVCQDCHASTVWHDNASNGANGSHPAKFDPDQCGSCHDYDAQVNAYATGASYGTSLANTDYKASYDSAGTKVFTAVTFPPGSGQAYKTGGNILGFGASPISRRVHAVHAGGTVRSDGSPMLNYPYEVYNGENVTITFPMDVKNCEKCHSSATSGTWKSKPSRLACLSCHDSDAAYAHAVTQMIDPTPTILTVAPVAGSTAAKTAPTAGPYSGDEIEACPVCHASK